MTTSAEGVELAHSWVDGRYSVYAPDGPTDIVVSGLLPNPAATGVEVAASGTERDHDPTRGAVLSGAVTHAGAPVGVAAVAVTPAPGREARACHGPRGPPQP